MASIAEEFTRQLKLRGLWYDSGEEEFRDFLDTDRVFDWEELIGLVPGMTLDDPTSWQDDQYDRRRAQRQPE